MFLAVFSLGAALGPVAQGSFSRFKAEAEFASAIGMLGLPQALFFYTKSGGLSTVRAAEIAKRAALVCAPFALAYGLYNRVWLGGAASIVFAGAVTSMIWQGNLRGVVLAGSSVRQFNYVMALPQLLMLVYALAAIAASRVAMLHIGVAFTIAFGAGILLGSWALTKRPESSKCLQVFSAGIAELSMYGLASGLTSVMATLATLIAIRTVQSRCGTAELGIYTFSAMLAQGVLMPLNYSMPLLFKRSMESRSRAPQWRVGLLVSLCFVGAGLLVYMVARKSPVALWMGAYQRVPAVLWILLLGAGADAFQKILAVDANARGRPWLPVVAESGRLVVLVGGVALLGASDVTDIAWVVSVAAFAGAVMLLMSFVASQSLVRPTR